MATLQSSGPISLGNIQTVMGGSNPASMSEYYRGGTYVPSTKTVTTWTEGPVYSRVPPRYYWEVIEGVIWKNPPVYFEYIQGQWNDTFVSLDGDVNTRSYTTGGYTYYKGNCMYYPDDGDGSSFYQISRSSTTTTNINTNVPTSGTISLSNFYGAVKP